MDSGPWWRGLPRGVIGLSAALVIAAIVLVGLSLRYDPPPSFSPTPLEPRDVGTDRVGPIRVTLDASHSERWVFFDFSRGAPVENPDPTGWDVAFRRFHIAVNGGDGFEGRGGALDMGSVPFDSVRSVPAEGYTPSSARRDSSNAAIERWYDYGFTSHLLTPKPRVYAIRTADGRYAALRFLSYYCPGATPGCVSFEYVYQGDGTRAVR